MACGPAGVKVEWDAEPTQVIRNQLLGWQSSVENRGMIRFEPAGDGGTRVTVRLAYDPPAGNLRHAIASAHGHTTTREELLAS